MFSLDVSITVADEADVVPSYLEWFVRSGRGGRLVSTTEEGLYPKERNELTPSTSDSIQLITRNAQLIKVQLSNSIES